MSRSRCFILTDYKLDRDYSKLDAQYVVWQKEKCPTTDRQHMQVCVYWENAKAVKTVRNKLPGVHVEIARNVEKSFAYCMKEESRVEGPWEIGEKPQQGKRSDIHKVTKMILENKPIDEIARENPETYIKFHRGINALRTAMLPTRNWSMEIHIIWGNSGTGKTSLVWDTHGINNIYPKDSTQWWDGYEGQEVVLLDDFDNSWEKHMPREFILKLFDRYPMKVQNKGGYLNFCSKKIYITSNFDPVTWYTNDEAFNRRITSITRL